MFTIYLSVGLHEPRFSLFLSENFPFCATKQAPDTFLAKSPADTFSARVDVSRQQRTPWLEKSFAALFEFPVTGLRDLHAVCAPSHFFTPQGFGTNHETSNFNSSSYPTGSQAQLHATALGHTS